MITEKILHSYFGLCSPVLLLVSVLVLIVAHLRTRQRVYAPITVGLQKKHLALFWICLACYLFLLVVLSSASVQWDDWEFLGFGKHTIRERFFISLQRYLSWVSRIGEIAATMGGLTLSRWHSWAITPLFAVAAPMAFFALVKVKGESIFSSKGKMFFLFAFMLCLLGVNLQFWRNYWCYAAAYNYLFPTVICIYFLSFFRFDGDVRQGNVWKAVGLFALGLVSGWGTECMTVLLLPLLGIWVAYNMFSKTNHLPFASYCGFVGFLWGASALYGSPALYSRNAADSQLRIIDIASMSNEQIKSFVSSLTWEKVELLKGGSGVITLSDIPLWLHIHFLPYILERFLQCCAVGLVVWLILFIVHAAGKGVDRRRKLLSALVMVLAALACAVSYIVKCIPTQMSFLPPCFILIAGCSYLYLRASMKVQKTLMIVMSLTGIFLLLPATVQAWQYRVQQLERNDYIARQIQEGKKEIAVKTIDVNKWWPTLGLFQDNDINTNPKAYPNGSVAEFFNIDIIYRIPKEAEKKAAETSALGE
ncbi:MAG: hypothetical protein KBT28_07370 [Bacteroidales bacterium]|nr:hypothetical protein [Candidatus Colimorpha merdihippi]